MRTSSANFGEGCYGLRAAAKEYYDVPVSKLSLPQAAYLVALLKSPTYFVENSNAAENRANAVLNAMVDAGKLSASRRASFHPALPHRSRLGERGGNYADWVAETLRVPDTRDYSPLPVHTTYDPKLQRLAEEAVETVLNEQGKKREAGQAAMVIMRTDGRVLAMVGGRNHADSQFNRAAGSAAARISVQTVCLSCGAPWGCPFRKFHPARIRIIRQNHRIIEGDVCDPARARNARRRPVQVAVPA